MNSLEWEDLNHNQQKSAIDSLTKTQETLGLLDFTLSSDQTYYKDYGAFDGSTVRLSPVFDKGISLDMAYRLVGIKVSTSILIPISNGIPVQLEKFPRECVEDVANIVSNLAPNARIPVKETFIVTAQCEICKDVVSSFVVLDGKHTCLLCSFDEE